MGGEKGWKKRKLNKRWETVAQALSLTIWVSSEHLWSHNQHEIKRHLLLGRKAMTNLDSILKSKDITLSTKVHIVKAMVFPVFM